MKLQDDYPQADWTSALLQEGEHWWHVSVGAKSAVFRRLFGEGDNEKRFHFETRDRDDLEDCCQWLNGKKLWLWAQLKQLNVRRPPYHDVEKWKHIILLIKAGELAKSPAADEAIASSPIPISAMRRFYDHLRLIQSSELHSSIAAYFAQNPRRALRLGTLWGQSLRHMRQYRNAEAAFIAKRNEERPIDPPRQWAHMAVWRAMQGVLLHDMALSYVAREMSPLRTTGSRYEDGSSGRRSGTGGIDLVLRTHDGVPVITEVKAFTDVGPFLALVQSMAYAVELVPGHQAGRCICVDDANERLCPSLPDGSDTDVEILILVEDPDADKSELVDVGTIVRHLLEGQAEEPQRLRKVTAAAINPGATSGDGPLQLEVIWSYSR